MDIMYYGHSCFKLKGKNGTVVMDPYNEYIGFTPGTLSADLVTVSHQHQDHNSVDQINGTSRRQKPFIVDKPGEYEVGGVSVFGTPTWHDASQGAERGDNTVFTVLLDDVTVCHLGDLGHELSPEQLTEIGEIDVVLCPVGGVFTIDPERATKTIHMLDPGIAIPMHYRTTQHNQEVFGELHTLEEFLKVYGAEVTPQAKLSIEKQQLPEETELVVLTPLQ